MRRLDILAVAGLIAVAIATQSTDAWAVGVGRTCGGFAGIRCNIGLWCQLPAGQCHIPDMAGKCVVAPRFCNQIYKPVCGCNGKTYANDCIREQAKVSKAKDGPCH